MKMPIFATFFAFNTLLFPLWLAISGQASAKTPTLTVLTYDSFVSEWGPGPAIEAAFEKECHCDLNFVAAGDGAALLARLQLEGQASDADVILGLDTNLATKATETGLFAPHGVATKTALPVDYENEIFLPYDWGWFAFVHNKDLKNPPKNFTELAASSHKIVIQDPRSSTPGLGLLMWVKAAYGEDAPQIWEELSDNVVTVTPGWSEAYGLFLEGEADMVLSYTTSPAYHLIAEGDDSKVAALFDEGHYMQVELVGRLKASDQPELAAQFLAFVQSEAFQSTIPTTNWMYPATSLKAGLPEGFDQFRPTKSLLMEDEKAEKLHNTIVEEWRDALSH